MVTNRANPMTHPDDDTEKAAREYAKFHWSEPWEGTQGFAHSEIIEQEVEAHLAGQAHERERIMKLVNQQAENEGLWFDTQNASEAYLQQELRKLHALVEGQE